jgi:prepilin-type N-terminal cleavage/methylation domain-containing protein
MSRGSKGFTLIEALVSITLVGVGMTAVLSGLSSMSKSQFRARESEKMQRLAIQKYDELIATEEIDGAGLSGNFSDINLDSYQWQAVVEPSGIENLETVTVTVERSGWEDGPQAKIDGLVYRPPLTTAAGGATP